MVCAESRVIGLTHHWLGPMGRVRDICRAMGRYTRNLGFVLQTRGDWCSVQSSDSLLRESNVGCHATDPVMRDAKARRCSGIAHRSELCPVPGVNL